jgi:hypothetical protein
VTSLESLADYTLPEDPEFCRPFTVALGPIWWSCASNRAILVAVREKGPFDSWAVDPDRMSRLAALLRSKPEASEKVDTSILRDWAGEGDDTRVGSCLGVPVNAALIAKLLESYSYPKINLWNASKVAGMASLGFYYGDKWRAFIGGVNPGTEAYDLDDFDLNPQLTVLEAVMSGEEL